MLVRVNDYERIFNENGVRVIQETGHGVRVNPSQIVSVTTDAVTGYQSNGTTEEDVFKVRFIGGTSIWTDEDGIEAIDLWEFPID
jgi:hypothetical protein